MLTEFFCELHGLAGFWVPLFPRAGLLELFASPDHSVVFTGRASVLLDHNILLLLVSCLSLLFGIPPSCVSSSLFLLVDGVMGILGVLVVAGVMRVWGVLGWSGKGLYFWASSP